MRWNENETLQLVKIYISHEFLWNKKHDHYNIKAKRLKGYRDIINEFNETTGISLTVTELRVKLKSLKSTYSQELTKIRKRSGLNWVYKPNMKWFAEWHKYIGNSKIIGNDNFDTQSNTEDQKAWLPQSDEIIEETLDPFPEPDDEYTIILKTDLTQNNTDKKYQQPDSSERFEMKRNKFGRRSSSIEYSAVRSSSYTDNSLEDEFDIYGKYIASQLRQMEFENALRVQLEIQSLVSSTRISELSNEH